MKSTDRQQGVGDWTTVVSTSGSSVLSSATISALPDENGSSFLMPQDQFSTPGKPQGKTRCSPEKMDKNPPIINSSTRQRLVHVPHDTTATHKHTSGFLSMSSASSSTAEDSESVLDDHLQDQETIDGPSSVRLTQWLPEMTMHESTSTPGAAGHLAREDACTGESLASRTTKDSSSSKNGGANADRPLSGIEALSMSEWEFWGESPPKLSTALTSYAAASCRMQRVPWRHDRTSRESRHGVLNRRSPSYSSLTLQAANSPKKYSTPTPPALPKTGAWISDRHLNEGGLQSPYFVPRRQVQNLSNSLSNLHFKVVESKSLHNACDTTHASFNTTPSVSPRSAHWEEEVWTNELRHRDDGVSVLGNKKAWVTAHLRILPHAELMPGTTAENPNNDLVAQLLRLREEKNALQEALELEKTQLQRIKSGQRKQQRRRFVNVWLKCVRSVCIRILWRWHDYVCNKTVHASATKWNPCASTKESSDAVLNPVTCFNICRPLDPHVDTGKNKDKNCTRNRQKMVTWMGSGGQLRWGAQLDLYPIDESFQLALSPRCQTPETLEAVDETNRGSRDRPCDGGEHESVFCEADFDADVQPLNLHLSTSACHMQGRPVEASKAEESRMRSWVTALHELHNMESVGADQAHVERLNRKLRACAQLLQEENWQLKQEVSELRRAQQQRHHHAGTNPIHKHDQQPIYAQGQSQRPLEALEAHDPALHSPSTSSTSAPHSTALTRSSSFPPLNAGNLEAESLTHCRGRGADGLGAGLVSKMVNFPAISPKWDLEGWNLDAHASNVHWENRNQIANAKIGEPLSNTDLRVSLTRVCSVASESSVDWLDSRDQRSSSTLFDDRASANSVPPDAMPQAPNSGDDGEGSDDSGHWFSCGEDPAGSMILT